MSLLRLLVVLSTIALTTACATRHVADEAAVHGDRAPAAEESLFNRLMDAKDSSQDFWVESVGKLVNLNLIAEGYIDSFEHGVTDALKKQKNDPTFFVIPTEAPIYPLIQAQHETIDLASDELVAIYKNLYLIAHQDVVAADKTEAPAKNKFLQFGDDVREALQQKVLQSRKDRAIDLLKGIHFAVEHLSEKDKLQLAPLIDRLKEVEENQDTAMNLLPKRDRMPASVMADFNAFHKVFKKYGKQNLSRLYKKHRRATARAAAAAAKRATPNYLALGQMHPTQERAPSADASKKLVPSPGKNGNVNGFFLPKGTFVLTFDDGPRPSSTERLLPILTENDMPATFFILAQNASAFPNTVAKEKAAGFPLNCHSWSHANLVLSSTNLDKEVTQAIAKTKQIFAYPADRPYMFFRCPYGACYAPPSVKVRTMIADAGLLHAYWVIDSNDWKFTKDPDHTRRLVTEQMQASGRGPILFHDIHETSVDVVKSMIPVWKSKGYKFETLEKAVTDYNASVE